ncbi:MAG TPA: serine/threonine-protein kinase, partial [Planctomycetaceae bacterium]|nr:serine/threonine-protein kinase [Planctomycetaceae bacterium]
EQHIRLAEDRAGTEAARQDLDKAQQELDERERRLTESEVDLSTRQITLAAEAERIEEERERLKEWSRRLREEQAFARAAKKQFQTTIDEFRSENRRFQMAIGAIRADRDRHRRRRVGSKQIAEDRVLAQLLLAEGVLDEAQAEWFADDQFGQLRPGGYEIVDFLGRGEETWICEALDPESKQRVALKILARPLIADPTARERLATEGRLGQAVVHPSVVRTLATGGEEDAPFLVMELVHGISLAELIGLHGTLTWREACNYAFQAAVGLGALHDAGVIHRGVEPGNLLVERDGGLKVGDFGTADAAFLHDSSGQSTVPTWSATAYASPELLLGDGPIDAQSDVFSLGCTIFHALSGSPPFGEPAGGKGGHSSAAAAPAPLRSLDSDLPADVARIVKKMMTSDRRKRFASMQEVAEALGSWAPRQQAYFDRPAIVAQRALNARARLRVLAREIQERQRALAPEPATTPQS